MDRRENIKVLLTGTVATGFLLSSGCKPDIDTTTTDTEIKGYGRVPQEILHDKKIFSETFGLMDALTLFITDILNY